LKYHAKPLQKKKRGVSRPVHVQLVLQQVLQRDPPERLRLRQRRRQHPHNDDDRGVEKNLT
jgi:hypothetical protein